MNRLIKACDLLDIRFLEFRYNDAEAVDSKIVTAQTSTTQLNRIAIEGMTCSACSASIEKELECIKGVFRANVSLALARATVSYDATIIVPEKLVEAIEELGYRAQLRDRSHEEVFQHLQKSEELQKLRAAISSASVCALSILGLERAVSFPFLPVNQLENLETPSRWLVLALAVRVQVWDAWPIHHRAWAKEKRKTATMDTLLSLSLLCGLGLTILRFFLEKSAIEIESYASSGTFLTVVILAGRYLETVLRREADSNLAALYDIQTQTDEYRLFDTDVTLPAQLLGLGDNVIVAQGQTIPCDCYIVNGSSAIDESTITGEAAPVTKGIGDFLLAGTRNITRALTVVVFQDQSKSSLAKVIEGVSTATEQRLQGTEATDSLMENFVFVVITLAGVTFMVAFSRNRTASFLASLTVACSRAMAVLAAACPCGIGLATPSAALAGIDAAYAQGSLAIGGIRTMETLNRVTHVVMDKTGTLTTGRLSVVGHEISRDLGFEKGICYRLLLAAEAEDAQVHPVARAVFKWALTKVHQTEASQEAFIMPETRELQQSLGNGVSCKVKVSPHTWTTVHIGTYQFLYENNIAIPTALSSDEKMPNVLFAFNHLYSGYLRIHDTLRHETPSIIKTLSASNLNVTLLTGDSAPEAERVSHLLNIPVLASRASPSDKLRCVQELQHQGHCVAMVGDGINDVLAQAAADVGVSISLTQGCLAGSGSVIITSGNLEALVHIFEISRKVVQQARWNVKWAITYNVVALSLAIGDWVTPAVAGSMMAFSSISVLSMSLWLRYRLSTARGTST